MKHSPARVDFKLVVGSLQETITVEGSPTLLNSDDAAVGTVVGADQIERLPVNGGALLGLLELTPGLIVTPATRGEAGQFTVDGQRPNTHYFTVDGVSVNSGVSERFGGGSYGWRAARHDRVRKPGQSGLGRRPPRDARADFHNRSGIRPASRRSNLLH